MKNVKKILFYLTIFILIILWQLLSGKTTYDYFWSYGFSLKLANGLVAYRDFNMVTTPFTQMFFAIFLFIFGKGIHIYIIFYSLILTLICYLLDVLYGKNGLVVVALMFISPNILSEFFKFIYLYTSSPMQTSITSIDIIRIKLITLNLFFVSSILPFLKKIPPMNKCYIYLYINYIP